MGALQDRIDSIAREISEKHGDEKAQRFRERASAEVLSSRVKGNGLGVIGSLAAGALLGPVGFLAPLVIGAAGSFLNADQHLDTLREIYLYD